MIGKELKLYKYLGNFLKERPPQTDNKIRQGRSIACNVHYRVEGTENGLCPFCRGELDFYLSLPRYHCHRYKKRTTSAKANRKRPLKIHLALALAPIFSLDVIPILV